MFSFVTQWCPWLPSEFSIPSKILALFHPLLKYFISHLEQFFFQTQITALLSCTFILFIYGPLLHFIKISFHPEPSVHHMTSQRCYIDGPVLSSFVWGKNENFNSKGLKDLILQLNRLVLPTTWTLFFSHFLINLIVLITYMSWFYL